VFIIATVTLPHSRDSSPGPTRQAPPVKGQPPVFSKFILQGRWEKGAQPAQKKMLDEFSEKYKLQDQDWCKQMMQKQ
jgi:hypothetical protein